MPIYLYRCDKCKESKELVQPMDAEAPVCCDNPMTYVFAPIAMVKMKGNPSFRKRYLGTAPYTTRNTSHERLPGGPGSKHPEAVKEGEKWVESLE
ncbi:hypothetical protein LCGC14_2450810 [marine sediment metagenome]|uniref:Putative regulatory protein FmdB zinc ribbon domain-containing protein n=1 Tax=marine sediment metagenome TaxID=412755 RepID=A0A0F9C3U4_9ZZZZ